MQTSDAFFEITANSPICFVGDGDLCAVGTCVAPGARGTPDGALLGVLVGTVVGTCVAPGARGTPEGILLGALVGTREGELVTGITTARSTGSPPILVIFPSEICLTVFDAAAGGMITVRMTLPARTDTLISLALQPEEAARSLLIFEISLLS
jgi:hypothetical protein